MNDKPPRKRGRLRDFSPRLRTLLLESAPTLAQAAKDLGTDRHNVYNWTKGHAHPSMPWLIRISCYTGVSLDYLLTGMREDDRSRAGHFDWFDRCPLK